MSGHAPVEDRAFDGLREAMTAYAPIAEDTWRALRSFATFRSIPRGHQLYPPGLVPTSFSFVFTGLLRAFSIDLDGREYNKTFFEERSFPGTMAALLTRSPARTAIEALEASRIVEIDFAAYRELLREAHDLALFQIAYLEKNWLLAKDAREIEMATEDAGTRYRRFVERHPRLSERLPQYHIASHLGITPTQLSRIRRK